MTLEVKYQALNTAAGTLEEVSADVSSARSYKNTFLHLDRSHVGIFQNIVNINDEVRTTLDEMLDRIKEVLDPSAAELRRAAVMYRDTDHDEAATMDQQYDDVQSQHTYRDHDPVEDTRPEKPEGYQPPAGVPNDGGGTRSW